MNIDKPVTFCCYALFISDYNWAVSGISHVTISILSSWKVRCITVLVLIKLTKNPVSLRLRCGSGKLYFCCYYTMFCDIRMLYIVWSLVRR